MMNETTIIGISGASASGKSHFAKQLYERLMAASAETQAAVLQEDGYYRDQSDLEFEQRELTNYDHPDAFEHSLLVRHLRQFLAGEPISTPRYDYAEHNRSDERLAIEPCRVLIVEGILLFHDPKVRELLDIKIFVDLPLDECLRRRIERDTALRGRSEDSVRKQFEETVRPMYKQFVEPTKDFADFIIHGKGDNAVSLSMLAGYMKSVARR